MDEDTLQQFHQITQKMRQRVYALDRPELLLLDLDSALLDTYGKQEGESFNFHYVTFQLCSNCPYKAAFYGTLQRIQQLAPS